VRSSRFTADCRSIAVAASGLALHAGIFLLCTIATTAPASGLQSFTDEAYQRGIVYLTPYSLTSGRGVAFVDLDDDGDADFVALGGVTGQIGVWENDGTGHFIDRSATTGMPILADASGISAADYDRDGDLDLFLTTYETAHRLLRNDTGFTFTDVSAGAGVHDVRSAFGSGWADINNDGWLDVYVANRPQLNQLYVNQGDGTFIDMAVELGVDRGDDPSFQGTFFDYDRDGDADLYVANDKGYTCDSTDWRNRIFENTGRGFIDVTDAMNAGACIAAMCIAIGDIDRNGYADVYCTNLPFGNVLQLNSGHGMPFIDAAPQYGVIANELGWGSVFIDYDNDAQLDLYVCNVHTNNFLYHNHNGDACQELGWLLGVASTGRTFCVATADVDLDGDVDMAIQEEDGIIKLYINNEGAQRPSVRFDVHGEHGARHAIGAVIDARIGSMTLVREVIAGSNYKSQNELRQTIGLGDDVTMIDEVGIMWPGGTIRTVANVPAGQTWALLPPDRLGDTNADGDVDVDDLLHVINAYHPRSGTIEPGQEALDLTGDWSITLDDIIAVVARLQKGG